MWNIFFLPETNIFFLLETQTKIRSWDFFLISLNFLWIMWNPVSRASRRIVRKTSMWLITWQGQECNRGSLFKWSSSEGSDNDTTDRKRTQGILFLIYGMPDTPFYMNGYLTTVGWWCSNHWQIFLALLDYICLLKVCTTLKMRSNIVENIIRAYL